MPHVTPPPEASEPPTGGDPTGTHRVLEATGALPTAATRLEAHPDLWDGEVRIEVTDVVLGADDHLSLQRIAAGDPGRMRAALLEAAAERGGLPPELVGSAIVGRVAARGTAAPPGPQVGDRVVVPAPVTALPLWLRDISGWSGGRHLPVAGHAIVHARTPLLGAPEEVPAEVVAVVAGAAHVPAAAREPLAGADRVLVLGPTTVEGAVAALVAAGAGAQVAGAVTGLHAARVARSLEAGQPVLAAPTDTQGSAAAILESLGGRPRVVLVADPDRDLLRAAAATVAPDGHVRILVPGADVDGLRREAAGLGSSPRIDLARTLPAGSHEIFHMLGSHPPFAALAAWRAGTAPAPEGAPITDGDAGPEGA